MNFLTLWIGFCLILMVNGNEELYDYVKPYVFELVNIPVIKGYSKYQYSSKFNILSCPKDNRLSERAQIQFEHYCSELINELKDSINEFCKYVNNFDKDKKIKALNRRKRQFMHSFYLTDIYLNKVITVQRPPDNFVLLQIKMNQLYKTFEGLKFKIFELKNLFGKEHFVKQLLETFEFNGTDDSNNTTNFYEFDSCNFDSTVLNLTLYQPDVLKNKKIVKLNAFKYLSNDKCLMNYAGSELFVFDFKFKTHCPLNKTLLQLLSENQPLFDNCNQIVERFDLMYNKNCSSTIKSEDLSQIKVFDHFYYLYCYLSKMDINNHKDIDCPNSLIRTPLINNLTVNGLNLIFNENKLNATV